MKKLLQWNIWSQFVICTGVGVQCYQANALKDMLKAETTTTKDCSCVRIQAPVPCWLHSLSNWLPSLQGTSYFRFYFFCVFFLVLQSCKTHQSPLAIMLQCPFCFPVKINLIIWEMKYQVHNNNQMCFGFSFICS